MNKKIQYFHKFLRLFAIILFFAVSICAFAQSADVAITQTVQTNGNDPNTSTFVVIVKNNGPNAATNVVVSENLNTTDWSFTNPSSNYKVSHGTFSWAGTNNNNLTWNIPYIANGGLAYLTFNVYRNFLGYETRSTTASISSLSQTDPTPSNNTSISSNTIDYNAHNLAVTNTVNNTLPNTGQSVQFTVTLTKVSGGSNANPIQITDKLPPGLTYTSHTVSSGTYVPSTGIWNIPKNSYAITGPETLVINATVNTPTGNTDEYKTAAALTAVGLDTDVTNNIATQSVTVATGASTDLKLTQTLNNYQPNIGDNVIFTINIENLGPNTASGARVTDQLPPGFTYVSSTATVGSYNNGTGLWTVGSFANGATATLNITATRIANGPNTNTATVVHNGTDSVSSNNSVSVTPTNVCNGTNTIVPGSGGLITVNAGEVYALYSGSWSGGVILNAGGTICISEGATFTASYTTGAINGTIINRGTITSYPFSNANSNNATILNYGTFTTGSLQGFSGSLENMNNGNFTVSNNGNALAGAVIINRGNMNLNNFVAQNASLTNYNSLTANANFTFLGNSAYLENKSTGNMSLNMTTGNTQIQGNFENTGIVDIKNANAGSGISAVVNNYKTMKIYQGVIFGLNTYLTNDVNGVLEFHNISSVEFQGPLLQNNNLMTIFNGGTLSLNSPVSQLVNNKKLVVGGAVSHNVAGSKVINNCTILSNSYFVGNGTSENNGLIWVTGEFKLEGNDSNLINSQTGFIRGASFRNSGDISGYGSFYFTGNTNFESAGTFVGSDPNSPIQFYDTTQTGNQIFDQFVISNPAINVIRPDSMIPLNDTTYNCSAPPTTAGYPPITTPVDIKFCIPATITFDLHNYVQPHPPVNGNNFTVLYSSIRLFDPNDAQNVTNNTTNLVIPGKGSLTANTTTGIVTFNPDPAFTSNSLMAEYRISNQWSGSPPIMPSSRTPITITINNLSDITISSGSTPLCSGETLQLSNPDAGGTWSSSDPSIASVDSNGKVTAVSTGNVLVNYTKYFSEGNCSLVKSINIEVGNCICYNAPVTTGTSIPTKMGITLLQRAGGTNSNWPMVRNGGHIALESNTKGLVITRMTTAQISAIVSPQEAMMVYDITAKCLKLYDGTSWSCFSTATCP